jgi:hypothetical protein
MEKETVEIAEEEEEIQPGLCAIDQIYSSPRPILRIHGWICLGWWGDQIEHTEASS